jgi:hypothetical protein
MLAFKELIHIHRRNQYKATTKTTTTYRAERIAGANNRERDGRKRVDRARVAVGAADAHGGGEAFLNVGRIVARAPVAGGHGQRVDGGAARAVAADRARLCE